MELDTDPELLWPLLLAQVVYDRADAAGCDFAAVSELYRALPLLPETAPALETAEEAEKVYRDLVGEHEIVQSDTKLEAQRLAEVYYAQFRDNLLAKLGEDSQRFEKQYRAYEDASGVPKEERINE